MKFVYLSIAVLALSACDTVRSFAPNTVAGFEAGGFVGGLDALSDATVAKCVTLDGVELRIAIDGLAALTDTGDAVADARETRRSLCAKATAVALLVDAVEGLVPIAGLPDPVPAIEGNASSENLVLAN